MSQPSTKKQLVLILNWEQTTPYTASLNCIQNILSLSTKRLHFYLCLAFIFSFFTDFAQNASVNYVNPLAQPDGQFTVCGNTERMTLRINNGNGTTMTGILATLHIPAGGKYMAGSITGATESNITNLNSPQFSVADIPSANTKDISYQISFECPVIAFQNGGGLTKETVDLSYNGAIIQSNVAPSSTYNVVAASLSIIAATNAAYSGNVGTTYNQTVTIRNGGLGCTSTGYLKLGANASYTFSNPSIGTISNDTIYFNSSQMPGGDGLWCNGEDLIVTYTTKINACVNLSRVLTAGWGCAGSICQISSNFPVGVTIPNNVPNLVGKVTFPNGYSDCPQSDYPLRYVIKNTGTGPATNIGVWLGGVPSQITSYNGSMGDSWFIPSEFQYSYNNQATLYPTTASNTMASGVKVAFYPSGGHIDNFLLNLPNALLQPGDSIIVTGFVHIFQQTDSTKCGWYYGYGAFSHKPVYSNQCGTVVVSGANATTSVGLPISEATNTVFAITDAPAYIQKNTCANFYFKLTFGSTMGNSPVNNPNRYAEVAWVIPTGLTYNNVAGNLVLTNFNTGATITPLPGYPMVVGNRLIVHFDPRSTLGVNAGSINVNLKLCNDCSLSGGGQVNIPMYMSIVRNNTCVPRIWNAINCQTLSTVLEGCSPGLCATGGNTLDIATSYIKRTTLGKPDNNLDGLPDASGSLDFTKIKTHYYAEADTMQINFKSIVSTGSVANLISSGIEMTVDTTKWLTAGTATVKIYDISTNTPYTCNVPVKFRAGGVSLNFSSCTPNGFTYENGDSVRVIFNLRVKNVSNINSNVVPSSPTVAISMWTSDMANPTASQKYSCNVFYYNYLIFNSQAILQINYESAFAGCGGTNKVGVELWSNEVGASNTYGFPYEYRPIHELDSLQIDLLPSFTFTGQVSITYGKSLGIGTSGYEVLPATYYTITGSTLKVHLASLWGSSPKFTLTTGGGRVAIIANYTPNCTTPAAFTKVGDYKAWAKSFRNTLTPTYQYIQGRPNSDGTLTELLSNYTFAKPALSLTSALPTVISNTGNATWSLALNNTNNNIAYNTFFYIKNGGSLNNVVVKNSSNVVVTPDANGFYQFGTLNGATTANYTITADLNKCSSDSLVVTTGWSCGSYPTSITAYGCGVSKTLYTTGSPAALDATFNANFTGANNTILLCQPFSVETVINSTLVGGLDAETYKVVLPKNIKYVANSVSAIYPSSGAYVASAYNPTVITAITGDTLVFAVNSLTGGIGLTGVGDLTHKTVSIKFNAISECGYISGKSIKAFYSGVSACGDPIATITKASSPINIFGAVPTSQYSFKLTTKTVFKSCEAGNNVTLTAYNTGSGSSVSADSVHLDIPAGLSIVPSSFVGIHNAPLNLNPVINGSDYKWGVLENIASGDSLTFSFLLKNDGTSCGKKGLTGSVTQNIPIACGATSCSTPVLTGLEIFANVDAVCCGSIGNYLWRDNNANGIQDEPSTAGINGLKLYLYKEITTGVFSVVDSVITANNSSGNSGFYNFAIANTGNYKVKFPLTSSGFILTTKGGNTGVDTDSDANISTGYSTVFTINLETGTGINLNNPTIDAGYICTKPNAGLNQQRCQGTTSVSLTGIPSTGTWTALSTNTLGAVLSATVDGVSTLTLSANATPSDSYNYIYTLGTCSDTMNVHIVLPTTSITNKTICSSEIPYLWNGISRTAAGTYTFTTTNSVGCDSVATLNLTVKATSTSTTNIAVCPNQIPYLWNGISRTSAGTYTFTTINSVGCDSVATLNLTVKATSTSTTNIAVCPNAMPYLWNGISRTAAGTYTFTTINSVGCDSVATLNLTVKATSTSTTNIAVCPNAMPYLWNGISRTAAGTYTFTTTNSVGCDSVATLNLTVKATSTSTTNIAVCPNAMPYLWNGISRTSAGTYTFTTINSVGCDSVATLNLTVKATSTSTTNIAVCPNEMPYLWNGISRTSAGTYTFTTTNSVGCDSVATLNLTVKATSTSTTNIAVCPSAMPYLWNVISRTAAGTYTFTTTNSVGCDSVATLNLTVKTTSTSTTNIAVCPNSMPYLWNGISRTAAGTYTFTTTNSVGCDSVATLNLTVKATSTSTTNIAVCPNQIPYLWNGISRTAAGTYTFTTTNSVGCDSVATLNLTVKNTSTSVTNIAVCPNAMPYLWNGISRTSAGTYTFTTTNSVGCDSVATLNLTVKATSTSTTNIEVCPNQIPYLWNGISRTSAGTYTFTTINSVGCDSVATLNLTVKATSISTTNIAVCPNAIPYLWNGISRTSAGTYTFTTINSVGCDSVATLNLTVKATSTSTTNIEVCPNQIPYLWNGISRTSAGTYTFTTTNSVGCDSVATLNLTVKATSTSTTNIEVCPNQIPYLWNGISRTTAGTYTFTTINSVGCDSVATLNLTVKATSTSTTNIEVCPNQIPYLWNGISRTAAGTYTFTTTNSVGCDSVATLNLTVLIVDAGIDKLLSCDVNGKLPISTTLTGTPANGIWVTNPLNPAATQIDSNTGQVTNLTQAGVYEFIYTVSSGNASCSDTVKITVPPCVIPYGSIGDFVFYDVNKNGLQDNGDWGIPNVKVYLLSGSTGIILDSTYTNSNGNYIFNNLVSDSYKIQISLPINYGVTSKNTGTDSTKDSDITSVGMSDLILIDTSSGVNDRGRNNLSIDAGIVKIETCLPNKQCMPILFQRNN